jgi:hypothetical protein
MAAVKDIKKGVCDNVFSGLSDVKKRIEALRDDLTRTYKTEDKLSELYERHLCELIDQIDWKLQIMSHACSYDWKGSAEVEYEENTVSVGPTDISTQEFAGGYLGG